MTNEPIHVTDAEFEEIALEVENLVEKGFNQIVKRLLAQYVYEEES